MIKFRVSYNAPGISRFDGKPHPNLTHRVDIYAEDRADAMRIAAQRFTDIMEVRKAPERKKPKL